MLNDKESQKMLVDIFIGIAKVLKVDCTIKTKDYTNSYDVEKGVMYESDTDSTIVHTDLLAELEKDLKSEDQMSNLTFKDIRDKIRFKDLLPSGMIFYSEDPESFSESNYHWYYMFDSNHFHHTGVTTITIGCKRDGSASFSFLVNFQLSELNGDCIITINPNSYALRCEFEDVYDYKNLIPIRTKVDDYRYWGRNFNDVDKLIYTIKILKYLMNRI